MTIHFIGLSCFLIENEKGYRIVVDPFNDAPEWGFGPIFPSHFLGKPFGANIVLMSEPDADHSRAPNGWLQDAPATAPLSDPFPNLDLRGTVVYEYNGDVNIAWHYTVDGVRCAHFADNAHLLTKKQLAELGHPDIIFWPFPKVDSLNPNALETTKENLRLLKPKLVICAHHIAPPDLPDTTDPQIIRSYFRKYFKNIATANKFYKGEESFIQLSYLWENALKLSRELPNITLTTAELKVTQELLSRNASAPTLILFRAMMATSKKYK